VLVVFFGGGWSFANADQTARTPREEAAELGKALADNWFDDEVNGGLVELMVSL